MYTSRTIARDVFFKSVIDHNLSRCCKLKKYKNKI